MSSTSELKISEANEEKTVQKKARYDKKQVAIFVLALLVIVAIIIVLVVVGVYFGVMGDDEPPSTSPFSSRSERSHWGVYRKAAVAADNTHCSQSGVDILKAGGSAVDSAIASLLCDGVQNMHSMGIGGGFFMTIYTRNRKEALVIDARESAPLAATESMNMTGAGSIGVPGEMRGYAEAHRQFGRLPWSDLFAPTIKMCREGFRVSKILAATIAYAGDPTNRCGKHAEQWRMSEIFYKNASSRELYQEGDVMRLPVYANTLERLAKVGAEDLYTGRLATLLVEDVRAVGGILTEEDLRQYAVRVKRPVQISLNGNTLYTLPPPSNGPILELILNILEGYNLTASDLSSTEASALTYHRVLEAFKFAYADRWRLGDEEFVDVRDILRNLTSEDYAAALRSQIWDNSTHPVSYYGPPFDVDEDQGTAHISVLDERGDAVAVTSTINYYFGACIMSPQTGIILNNEMWDFSSPDSRSPSRPPPPPTNFIAPGKRPMSSMCPTIVTDGDGDVRLVIGTAGGSLITTSTAWVMIHDLWLGKPINEAVDVPRLHHSLVPNRVKYEKTFDKDIKHLLESKYGHTFSDDRFKTVVQAISLIDGLISAVADHRKNAEVRGY